MTQATQQLPTKVPAMNTLGLEKSDWNALRDTYGAVKDGAWKYETFLKGAMPNFKLAAQIDLDRFHGGEEHQLDWPTLFANAGTVAVGPDKADAQPADGPTPNQLALFNQMLAERGLPTVEAFAAGTTRKQASEAIDNLKAIPKAKAAPAEPGSLVAMAQQINGTAPAPPVVEKIDVVTPVFTDAELKAIRGMAFVEMAECGEHSDEGNAVLDKIGAYFSLKGEE